MKKISSFFAVVFVISSCFTSASRAEPNETRSKKFLWGAANASFQVEGSPVDSDWYRWTHTPGKIADGTDADHATDFWNRYDEDFKLAQDLGANAFRISIAWERIEPSPGQWDEQALAKYQQIILSMRAHGLEPVVTLHHFVLPEWISEKGGLLSPEFPQYFADYAFKVVTALSSAPCQVTYWMTFNEPMVLVSAGYYTGEWPPGITNDLQSATKAAANIAKAHVQAVAQLRKAKMDRIQIGIAHHWRDYQATGINPLDYYARGLVDDLFNRQFVLAITKGEMNAWIPGVLDFHEKIPLPDGKSTLDYLGINYYGRTIISTMLQSPYIQLSEGPGPKTDIGWEMYPQGLYHVLRDASEFKVPLMVSENGLADKNDQWRAKFLDQHLHQIDRARKDGINVFGYLHWSLTDNFEWAKGLSPRFGLVEIDYSTGKRTPRASFLRYHQLIESYH